MSKIEIIGPREQMFEILSLVQQLGVLQIEEDLKGMINEKVRLHVKSLLLDRKTLAERLFFENLKEKIDSLLAFLPKAEARETYLDPAKIVDVLAELVEKHLQECQAASRKKEVWQNELKGLDRFGIFLDILRPLLEEARADGDLDFIGVEIKEPAMMEQLTRVVHQLTGGRFEIQTARGPEGPLAALITIERESSEKLKNALRQSRLPELPVPSGLEKLPLREKIRVVPQRRSELAAGIDALGKKQAEFARRWQPIYQKTGEWVNARLALLQKTAALFETEMCFFLFGWVPSAELQKLRGKLAERFGGQVVVEEKEILEQDLEKIPVAMKNPLYFKPFELFARLLPLPRYGSFDPTPFFGIFFPIFFGMILGDIGYGIVLLLVSLTLVLLPKGRKNLTDAGKILGICALYTIFFGWIFGECFGDFGREVLGLTPICFDRRTAIMPMLYFSLSVGIFHLILGLSLGFLTALRRKKTKEALFKLFNILAVLCLVILVASFFMPVLFLARKPMLITVLIIVPILVLTGGLLAPLELLKTFGNIVSYARIMAVGLTSVLLAYVANRLAGMAGSIVVGVIVAILLHTFNIILGVFAPTIHSLRLHYVEFFSKFLEPGGKKFEPMERE